MPQQEQKDVSILPPSQGDHLLLMEGSYHPQRPAPSIPPSPLASLLLKLQLTIMRQGTLHSNFPLFIRPS